MAKLLGIDGIGRFQKVAEKRSGLLCAMVGPLLMGGVTLLSVIHVAVARQERDESDNTSAAQQHSISLRHTSSLIAVALKSQSPIPAYILLEFPKAG